MLRDFCTFSCNPGYELQGAHNGTCLNNDIWSGGLPSCVPINCSDRIYLDEGHVSLVESTCRLPYLSRCIISCRHGSTGDHIIYLCNVTSNPAVVDWVPIGGVHSSCERGMFYSIVCKCINLISHYCVTSQTVARLHM